MARERLRGRVPSGRFNRPTLPNTANALTPPRPHTLTALPHSPIPPPRATMPPAETPATDARKAGKTMPTTHRLGREAIHTFWDNSLPPQLTIAPGDTVVFDTLDASYGGMARGFATDPPADLDPELRRDHRRQRLPRSPTSDARPRADRSGLRRRRGAGGYPRGGDSSRLCPPPGAGPPAVRAASACSAT